MKIISQNINIFNPGIYKAVIKRDDKFIRNLASQMLKNGAYGLEINLGGWRTSDSAMPWLVKQIRKISNCPLFLSPIPASLKEAAEADSIGNLFINCVTADSPRLESMLNAAHCLNTSIVVLLTKTGLCPSNLDEILILAEEVLEKAEKADIRLNRVILDPVLRPRLSMNSSGYMTNRPDVTFFAEAIALIGMLREYKIKTAAGLSNLTVGMDGLVRHHYEISAANIFVNAGLDYCVMDCSNRQKLNEIALEQKPTERPRFTSSLNDIFAFNQNQ